MLKLERRLRIVFFCDVLPKLLSNSNVLLTVCQHFFTVFTEVFEVDLVIGQPPSPRLERCRPFESLWNLRILFIVKGVEDFLGPDESGADECVNDSSVELNRWVQFV